MSIQRLLEHQTAYQQTALVHIQKRALCGVLFVCVVRFSILDFSCTFCFEKLHLSFCRLYILEKPTTIAKKENTTARSATKSKSKTKTATTTQTHTSTKKSAQSEQKYTQAVAKAKELSVPYSEPQKEEPQVGTDANAVVMTSYSHDWVQPNAQISVKNNTDKEITSITGRMIYYDMSGNMLDYQDFTKRIDIDAGMTKRFELRGYNYEESYAYYRSKTIIGESYKKYKVEFQLKSYTYK